MPETTRIAYLVSRYPTASHTFILREIVALRSLGFDLEVIAIRGADRPDEAMTAVEREENRRTRTVLPFGLHFLWAHCATALRNPGRYIAGWRLALKLSRYKLRSMIFHSIYLSEALVAGRMISRAGRRHVHTHFSSTVALLASRVFGFSLSMTIHGSDEFRDTVAFGMVEKVAASRFIVAISQYGRGQVMLGSDPEDWPKVEICRLGVDTSVFEPAASHSSVPRNSGKAPGDVFRVISVGRLVPVKAHQILIDACARLVAKGWQLQLHLVGGGPDLNSLQRFTGKLGMTSHVVFEGSRNQDEVIALYKQADVFALSSFIEGVPVVLMEAMAMELPCVSTWVTGIPELIRDNQEGLLVAPSDVEGLALAIERLLGDQDLRSRLGRAGRRQVLENYDLRRNTLRLAELFRKYVPESF